MSTSNDIDITEPPYPSMTSRWPDVYKHLKALRGWLAYHRTGVNSVARADIIPDLPEMIGLTSFGDMPAVTFYQDLVMMRRIRESWDQIVRDFGDSHEAWNSKYCFEQRRDLLVAVFHFLAGEACMSVEAREAKVESLQRHAIGSSLGGLLAFFDRIFAFKPNPVQGEQGSQE